MKINDPELLATNAYVDGAWCGAASNESFDVTNPATGEVIAALPNLGRHGRSSSGRRGARGPKGVGGPSRQGEGVGAPALA